jgi:hypothetical protein
MPTTTDLITPVQVADCGGEPVSIRVDWDTASTPPITDTTPCRLVLKVRNGVGPTDFTTTIPNRTDTPLYLYSGIPQQTWQGCFCVYPNLPDESDVDGYRNDASNLAPVYHWFRGYTPRLAPGVYYVVLEYWDSGTSAWVQAGGPTSTETGLPFRVLVRSRFEEIYQHRRLSPAPYKTGTRSIDEEAAV